MWSLVTNQRPLRKETPVTRNEDFFMGLSQMSSLKTKQNPQTALHIFHQNSRGLKHKTYKLMCMLDSCVLSPHIICLLEHYLVDHKLFMINPNNYYLHLDFHVNLTLEEVYACALTHS